MLWRKLSSDEQDRHTIYVLDEEEDFKNCDLKEEQYFNSDPEELSYRTYPSNIEFWASKRIGSPCYSIDLGNISDIVTLYLQEGITDYSNDIDLERQAINDLFEEYNIILKQSSLNNVLSYLENAYENAYNLSKYRDD